MTSLRSEDGKKWIFSFVAIVSLIVSYMAIKFLGQMSEWFDLEAKVSNFVIVSQFVGIAVGLLTFIFIIKNSKASLYMNDVYGELVKVIWPEKDGVVKLTIGIVIGVVIASGVLVLIDMVFGKLLEFIY